MLEPPPQRSASKYSPSKPTGNHPVADTHAAEGFALCCLGSPLPFELQVSYASGVECESNDGTLGPPLELERSIVAAGEDFADAREHYYRLWGWDAGDQS